MERSNPNRWARISLFVDAMFMKLINLYAGFINIQERS